MIVGNFRWIESKGAAVCGPFTIFAAALSPPWYVSLGFVPFQFVFDDSRYPFCHSEHEQDGRHYLCDDYQGAEAEEDPDEEPAVV